MKYLLFALSLTFAPLAHADYTSRLSLGAGVAVFNDSHTYFEVGGEYEQRLNAMIGLGGFVDYIFSDPGFAIVGLPEVFLHPLGGEWYVSAAPIAEFGSGTSTHFGARLGTRFPISFGMLSLIPTAAVDFINGGTDYLFGIGIQF